MKNDENEIIIKENEIKSELDELDEILKESERQEKELKKEARKLISEEGELNLHTNIKERKIIEDLEALSSKMKSVNLFKKAEKIDKMLNQLRNISNLSFLNDKTLLVDFSKDSKGLPVLKKIEDKKRKTRDNNVRKKLAKNKKYTFVEPFILEKILYIRLPEGRKHYSSSFMSILFEFIKRVPLKDYAVWISDTLNSIFKLKNENYNYKFLQEIIDLMEKEFNFKVKE